MVMVISMPLEVAVAVVEAQSWLGREKGKRTH